MKDIGANQVYVLLLLDTLKLKEYILNDNDGQLYNSNKTSLGSQSIFQQVNVDNY
jgi:hypothetical protein